MHWCKSIGIVGVLTSALVGITTTPARATTTSLEMYARYQATMTPDPSCTMLLVDSKGHVSGTPADGTWTDHECVNEVAHPGVLTIDGNATIDEGNENKMFIRYHATASIVPSLPARLRPSGTFTVTGGTGRYARAIGGGSVTADVWLLGSKVLKPVTVPAMADLRGTIQY